MPAEPTYVTADDLRLFTNNDDLADDDIVTDEQLEAKIVAAEVYIDAIAGYWERAGGITQARVFPRTQDTQNGQDIPDSVMHATIAQVEFMHVNMPDIEHGIENDASPTANSISPRAKKLMSKGYICRTGQVTIPYSQNPKMLQIYNSDAQVNGDIHFQDVSV